MFETVLDDDGILPDVQELLEMIPDDAQHSKLYISADVEYHPLDEDISEEQQTILKDLMTHVLNRIGVVLRIEDELLEQWVAERVNRTVDHDADSVYAVAALILSTLEAKQNILASPTLDEAIEELVHHVALVQEEE